jgi:hypothetical protein
MKVRQILGTLAKWYLYLVLVIYMVIAPIGIVFFDPAGVGSGLSRLWSIYSPFNFLNWLTLMAFMLPGVLLMAWTEKR